MATTSKRAAETGKRGTEYRYAADFRREALRLIDSGKTAMAVREELSIPLGTATHSRLKAAASTVRGLPSGAARETVTAEYDRLKREVKTLRMGLEIAKIAADFFGRHGA